MRMDYRILLSIVDLKNRWHDFNGIYGGVFSDGFLTLEFLKKYVSFARQNCGPRLTDSASEKLVSHYVRMRNPPVEENHQKSALFLFYYYLRNTVGLSAIRMSRYSYASNNLGLLFN